MVLTFEEALAAGRAVEAAFLRHLARRGLHAVGINKDADDETEGGPRVHTPDGMTVAADILYVDEDGGAGWVEVKSKTGPSWRYTARRWEPRAAMRRFPVSP